MAASGIKSPDDAARSSMSMAVGQIMWQIKQKYVGECNRVFGLET